MSAFDTRLRAEFPEFIGFDGEGWAVFARGNMRVRTYIQEKHIDDIIEFVRRNVEKTFEDLLNQGGGEEE